MKKLLLSAALLAVLATPALAESRCGEHLRDVERMREHTRFDDRRSAEAFEQQIRRAREAERHRDGDACREHAERAREIVRHERHERR